MFFYNNKWGIKKSRREGGTEEGVLIRGVRRLWQRIRIRCCSHRPWIILQQAEDIWCCGAIALEFYQSKEPPERTLGYVWQARVAVCSRCGGTIDEITFACNALGEKDSVLVYPDEYPRLLKGCGTIDRWN